MKNQLVILILVAASCLLLAGCIQATASASSDAAQYFPEKVGSEWLYKVDVKEGGAVTYQETSHYIRRGMVYPLNGSGNLKIKIEKTADKQCGTSYPGGLQLQVVEDDFKIFRFTGDIFWVKLDTSYPGEYMIDQQSVVEGSPFGDSCARRTIFTAVPENTGIKGGGSKDELIYLGKETVVYKGWPTECMHFLRIVNESDGSLGYLGGRFTEESWYAPGKGMVRMEQKIEGKTSMTWELESFKSG